MSLCYSDVDVDEDGVRLCRTDSIGASSSSPHNSDGDDYDSDGCSTTSSFHVRSQEVRRREAHTYAEQKRRDSIRKGYDDLEHTVPTCQNIDDNVKLSKAAILQKSIEYMQFLTSQKKKMQEDLETLRKDVVALEIMQGNYEQIVRDYQVKNPEPSRELSDSHKFQVFSSLVDELFVSFNLSVGVSSFNELSGCVISWQEEYCKPHTLREMCLNVLRQINTQLQQPEGKQQLLSEKPPPPQQQHQQQQQQQQQEQQQRQQQQGQQQQQQQ